MSVSLLSIGLLTGLGLAACWFDVVQRRLPNWLSLLTFSVGIGVALVTSGTAALPWNLVHALIALIVGMGLFALRAVGGGDAKYYAANAAWFGIDVALRLLVAVSMAGLVVLLIWAVWRRARGEKIFAKSPDERNKLPYGVAIAIGAVLAWWGSTY